ncbi:hypothetical protein SEA_LILMARTIN_52 [Streptomyces phage LilMartin]|nr:hypothetical protein SEA_LILMARTIN_52 [Streptomyces phage LilMartin]QNO12476.1 hypothetical protein SEA_MULCHMANSION_52 [Streptomyces phage MulchMansion]UVK61149.1 hypothetical protein SEA_ANGELA_52 [Streptomyces phage Angela]
MTYNITGTHALNRFTQAKLIEQGLITLSNYDGLSPIIPAQQQPEFTNEPAHIPFFVYNYAQAGAYEDWWLEHEELAYVMYCDDEELIRKTIHYLNQLFKRYDWSADEVNNWLTANGSPAQKAFNFKYIRVINVTSIEPATEEGGRHSAMVVLRLCFTSDLDQSGMRA